MGSCTLMQFSEQYLILQIDVSIKRENKLYEPNFISVQENFLMLNLVVRLVWLAVNHSFNNSIYITFSMKKTYHEIESPETNFYISKSQKKVAANQNWFTLILLKCIYLQ